MTTATVARVSHMTETTANSPSTGAALTGAMTRHAVLIASITLFLSAAALYGMTMAPGLTWENDGGDGGDFLAAAHTWGIPHPTGYPTYMVALRSFSEVVPLGDEAFRGNLFSVTTGALAVAFFFLATRKMLLRLPLADTGGRALPFAAAVVAAIAFATSNLHWSQSTITEVYAFNAMFVCLALWTTLRARSRIERGQRALWLRTGMAFLFGVALGNHVTIAFVAVPLAVWLYWPLVQERNWRTLLKEWQPPLALLIGISIYVYAPIASSQDPALNWFFPDTFEGFRSMVSATIYQPYVFGVSPSFIDDRVIYSFDLWLTQYTAVGAILGLAGVMFLWTRERGLAVATLSSLVALLVYTIAYNSFDAYVFLVPVFIIFGAWIAAGLLNLASISRTAAEKTESALVSRHRARVAPAVLAIGVIAMPLWSVVFNYEGVDISSDTEASDYMESAMETAGQGGIIITEDIPTFGLWYQSLVAEPERDVAVVAVFLLRFDWYWDHIKRQYPDRVPDGEGLGTFQRVRAIASHNLGRSGVYLTHPESGYADQFQLSEAGELWRVEE